MGIPTGPDPGPFFIQGLFLPCLLSGLSALICLTALCCYVYQIGNRQFSNVVSPSDDLRGCNYVQLLIVKFKYSNLFYPRSIFMNKLHYKHNIRLITLFIN